MNPTSSPHLQPKPPSSSGNQPSPRSHSLFTNSAQGQLEPIGVNQANIGLQPTIDPSSPFNVSATNIPPSQAPKKVTIAPEATITLYHPGASPQTARQLTNLFHTLFTNCNKLQADLPICTHDTTLTELIFEEVAGYRIGKSDFRPTDDNFPKHLDITVYASRSQKQMYYIIFKNSTKPGDIVCHYGIMASNKEALAHVLNSIETYKQDGLRIMNKKSANRIKATISTLLIEIEKHVNAQLAIFYKKYQSILQQLMACNMNTLNILEQFIATITTYYINKLTTCLNDISQSFSLPEIDATAIATLCLAHLTLNPCIDPLIANLVTPLMLKQIINGQKVIYAETADVLYQLPLQYKRLLTSLETATINTPLIDVEQFQKLCVELIKRLPAQMNEQLTSTISRHFSSDTIDIAALIDTIMAIIMTEQGSIRPAARILRRSPQLHIHQTSTTTARFSAIASEYQAVINKLFLETEQPIIANAFNTEQQKLVDNFIREIQALGITQNESTKALKNLLPTCLENTDYVASALAIIEVMINNLLPKQAIPTTSNLYKLKTLFGKFADLQLQLHNTLTFSPFLQIKQIIYQQETQLSLYSQQLSDLQSFVIPFEKSIKTINKLFTQEPLNEYQKIITAIINKTDQEIIKPLTNSLALHKNSLLTYFKNFQKNISSSLTIVTNCIEELSKTIPDDSEYFKNLEGISEIIASISKKLSSISSANLLDNIRMIRGDYDELRGLLEKLIAPWTSMTNFKKSLAHAKIPEITEQNVENCALLIDLTLTSLSAYKGKFLFLHAKPLISEKFSKTQIATATAEQLCMSEELIKSRALSWPALPATEKPLFIAIVQFAFNFVSKIASQETIVATPPTALPPSVNPRLNAASA